MGRSSGGSRPPGSSAYEFSIRPLQHLSARWIPLLPSGKARAGAARAGARRRLERQHIDSVGVMRVHDDGKAEIGRQPLADRSPRATVVVAAKHTNPRAVWPAAVVLDVEPAGRVLVAPDLVHALA